MFDCKAHKRRWRVAKIDGQVSFLGWQESACEGIGLSLEEVKGAHKTGGLPADLGPWLVS